MTQFQYTAVNTTGKKLNGVIGAESENDARKQLNILGISILEIKKSSTKNSEKPKGRLNLDLFEFEAYDKTGRRVVGTIPASNRFKAFKRLMEEYKFEVSYVVKNGASEAEKEQAKHEDLSALKADYEASYGENTKAKDDSDESNFTPQFEEQRKALVKKVDHILEKIKSLISEYEQEIRPENKKIIQEYVDKLLRIKSSTNLDYIEHTSEELLKKVQDQEIFLHKEKMGARRQQLKLESQKMMAVLHSGSGPRTKGVMDDLEDLSHKLRQSANPIAQFMQSLINKLIPSPELKALKEQVRNLNRQVWTFRRIWLTADKSIKNEAYQSLQRIISERDRIKSEIHEYRKNMKEATRPKEKGASEPVIFDELTSFLGWLLSLYLSAYFTSYYVLAKAIPSGNPLPGDFNLLASGMLRSLLISLFLWYALFSIRVRYLRYTVQANSLILPLAILLNAILLFNL